MVRRVTASEADLAGSSSSGAELKRRGCRRSKEGSRQRPNSGRICSVPTTPGEHFDRDRWIRDLSWAITSPLLMRPTKSGESEPTMVPDFEEATIEWAGAEWSPGKHPGRRVGRYFESLVYHWLKHIRGVEILAQGYQVVREGRTVGELDVVFRDEDGRVNHWEVAAKFYLHSGARKVGGSHFIGPNVLDSFERKRNKIFSKQLPLSGEVMPEVSRRAAFVKGRIFYHWQQPTAESSPELLMPNHLRGIWLRHCELSWLESENGLGASEYHLVEKPFWLAPEKIAFADASPLSFPKLRLHLEQHFSREKRPILLSALVREASCRQEVGRVFVVPDQWPALA